MPTLDWIGKRAVVNHHREVPTRLLHCDSDLSCGDPDAGNLLVQGDNLEALKALLPFYAGKVKCIYIDPPYNTGNEGWIYNDNSSSPELKNWLGSVVGKEAEDLSRHDKWLCMMYPRLRLLKDFLSDDGCIVVSIDDVELASLRLVCDDIFGRQNFLSSICWQKIYTVKNSAQHISGMHDYLIMYAKSKSSWSRNLRPRDEGTDEDYSNVDGDKRGAWISHALQSRNYYSKGIYKIQCPGGRLIEGPPDGTYWRVEETKFWELDADKRVWWGINRNNAPRIKEFLSEAKDGVVPVSWWTHKYAGTNSGAKTHLRDMMDGDGFFDTPKPIELIERILDLASDKDSLVLDAFAGSGTTGHAVLRKNLSDGGSRKFILIETMGEVARGVTKTRIQKAILGYESIKKEDVALREATITMKVLRNSSKLLTEFDEITASRSSEFESIRCEIVEDRLTLIGERSKPGWIEGLGSGFRFCTLGLSLFDEWGTVSEGVTFADLAAFVFFSDTGSPIPSRADGGSPLIGSFQGRAIYLLFDSEHVGVAHPVAGNVLTVAVMEALPLPDPNFSGPRIVYAEGCTVPAERLAAAGVVFKQVPYQLAGT